MMKQVYQLDCPICKGLSLYRFSHKDFLERMSNFLSAAPVDMVVMIKIILQNNLHPSTSPNMQKIMFVILKVTNSEKISICKISNFLAG